MTFIHGPPGVLQSHVNTDNIMPESRTNAELVIEGVPYKVFTSPIFPRGKLAM